MTFSDSVFQEKLDNFLKSSRQACLSPAAIILGEKMGPPKTSKKVTFSDQLSTEAFSQTRVVEEKEEAWTVFNPPAGTYCELKKSFGRKIRKQGCKKIGGVPKSKRGACPLSRPAEASSLSLDVNLSPTGLEPTGSTSKSKRRGWLPGYGFSRPSEASSLSSDTQNRSSTGLGASSPWVPGPQPLFSVGDYEPATFFPKPVPAQAKKREDQEAKKREDQEVISPAVIDLTEEGEEDEEIKSVPQIHVTFHPKLFPSNLYSGVDLRSKLTERFKLNGASTGRMKYLTPFFGKDIKFSGGVFNMRVKYAPGYTRF